MQGHEQCGNNKSFYILLFENEIYAAQYRRCIGHGQYFGLMTNNSNNRIIQTICIGKTADDTDPGPDAETNGKDIKTDTQQKEIIDRFGQAKLKNMINGPDIAERQRKSRVLKKLGDYAFSLI